MAKFNLQQQITGPLVTLLAQYAKYRVSLVFANLRLFTQLHVLPRETRKVILDMLSVRRRRCLHAGSTVATIVHSCKMAAILCSYFFVSRYCIQAMTQKIRYKFGDFISARNGVTISHDERSSQSYC